MAVGLVRMAEVFLGLVRDLRIGVLNKGELHLQHAPSLREVREDLARWGEAHSSLRHKLSLLWNYARSERRLGPHGVTLVDLRKAAEGVYEEIAKEVEPDALAGVKLSLADGTSATVAKLRSDHPRPSEVHRAFHRFSPSLQGALSGSRKGVSTVDRDPEKLRAAVREWLTTVIPSLDPLLDSGDLPTEVQERMGQAGELFSWLSTTPVPYQHDLVVTWALKEGMRMELLHRLLQGVNRLLETRGEERGWVLETEARTTESESVKKYRSFYRFLEVTADPALKEGFERVVPNEEIRSRIVKGMEEVVASAFSSEERLKGALATALVRLNPLDEMDLAPDLLRERLQACVAAFELFLGAKPLLDQAWFFHQRLVRAGMDHLTQRALLARIGQVLGIDYRFHRPSLLYRIGESPSFLSAPVEAGGEKFLPAEGERLQQVALCLQGVLEALERGENFKRIRGAHAEGLREVWADLLSLARTTPKIRSAVDRLHSFAVSRDRQGPNRTLRDLKKDCQVVRRVVESRLKALRTKGATPPVVSAVTGFSHFSDALKRKLKRLVPRSPTKRFRGRGRTASLEKSPDLLRAVAAEWTGRALKRMANSSLPPGGGDGEKLLEVMHWLAGCSPRSYVDGFFRKLMGRREIQKLGGIDFVRRMVSEASQLLRGHVEVVHERKPIEKHRTPDAPPDFRTVYFVRSPLVTPGGEGEGRGTFRAGETLVMPTVGIVTFVAVEERDIGGQNIPVYVVRCGSSRLVVSVGANGKGKLRRPIEAGQVEEIYRIVREKSTGGNGQPLGKAKALWVKQLKRGSLADVAAVVRDLRAVVRRRPSDESLADLLEKAERTLVSELAHVSGEGEKEVRRRLG